ncbi:hypothetical protein [Actinomadura litoris]|uniref:hypothetical protein n=1 Tax=Actinomadura litoris TaxID=2678616 RepID=UPI001FA810AF|nr:hypothetical protein [Actinomadura litoris]
MASDEYYIVSAVKIRFENGAAVCAAARSELARLQERHGDDAELQRFFTAPPASPASAMLWLTSPTRLKYLHPGLDVQAESQFLARADVLKPIPPAHEGLRRVLASGPRRNRPKRLEL